MALVRHMDRAELQTEVPHTEANATYTIIRNRDGSLSLQVDTYGSEERKLVGKKSQSIRFAPEAVEQLRRILTEI